MKRKKPGSKTTGWKPWVLFSSKSTRNSSRIDNCHYLNCIFYQSNDSGDNPFKVILQSEETRVRPFIL
jgi:hypothetical protein